MYNEALKYYDDNYMPKYKQRQHLFFMQKNISDECINTKISNEIYIIDEQLKAIEKYMILRYGFIIFNKIKKVKIWT